jgi:hypothetical protein
VVRGVRMDFGGRACRGASETAGTQVLEPQRQIAAPKDVGREALEDAVAVEEQYRRLGPIPGMPG